MISSTIIISLSRVPIAKNVGDALGHGYGGAELVRDVREEVGLRRRSLPGALLDLGKLHGQALPVVEGLAERACHQGRRPCGQRCPGARRRRSDRPQYLVGTLLSQDVAGRARGQHLRHQAGIDHIAVADRPRSGRGGAEPLDQLGASQALQRELGHDHIGSGAGRELHGPKGVGRDLELQVGTAAKKGVLQLSQAVGRVAQQDGDSHLWWGIGRA
jgi:hypothetical protein